MDRIYMFTDEPGVMEGYYRLRGPALSDIQRGNLSLVDNGYSLDHRERLPARELIFRDQETILLRPKENETYFGDVEHVEGFEIFQELPNAPKHDPETKFPNKWEIEETVRYMISREYQMGAVRFDDKKKWKLTPEQNKELTKAGFIMCPCQMGMDPEKDMFFVCGFAEIVYFDRL
jgi:hypothetical protein